MYAHSSRLLSRRGFCTCCAVAAGLAANGRWLRPAEAYAEARDIVDAIRDAAATMPLQLHKLRVNVTVIEGSGGESIVDHLDHQFAPPFRAAVKTSLPSGEASEFRPKLIRARFFPRAQLIGNKCAKLNLKRVLCPDELIPGRLIDQGLDADFGAGRWTALPRGPETARFRTETRGSLSRAYSRLAHSRRSAAAC